LFKRKPLSKRQLWQGQQPDNHNTSRIYFYYNRNGQGMKESKPMDYREKLIEMINSINNTKYMEYLYLFAKRLAENWRVL